MVAEEFGNVRRLTRRNLLPDGIPVLLYFLMGSRGHLWGNQLSSRGIAGEIHSVAEKLGDYHISVAEETLGYHFATEKLAEEESFVAEEMD